jgi:hypothetical protein
LKAQLTKFFSSFIISVVLSVFFVKHLLFCDPNYKAFASQHLFYWGAIFPAITIIVFIIIRTVISFACDIILLIRKKSNNRTISRRYLYFISFILFIFSFYFGFYATSQKYFLIDCFSILIILYVSILHYRFVHRKLNTFVVEWILWGILMSIKIYLLFRFKVPLAAVSSLLLFIMILFRYISEIFISRQQNISNTEIS